MWLMPKRRSKDGAEFWRGKYRKLQKENRQLREQLRQYEQPEKVEENLTEEDSEVLCDGPDGCFRAYVPDAYFEFQDKCIVTCPHCGIRKNLNGQ